MKKEIISVKETKIKTRIDSNGKLCFIENNSEIPFSIKRIFYIYDVPQNETRGNHAHKICNQFFICLKGSIEVICDDGSRKKNTILNDPQKGLFVPNSIWASQHYLMKKSILLVLTDQDYSEDDYIKDYNNFLDYRTL